MMASSTGSVIKVTSMPTWALLLTILVISYAISLARWHRRSGGRPLPPGPKSWPFLGNFSHMTKPELWRAHDELCHNYGELVYLSVMGKDLLILGSSRVVSDLLEKRSALTSDKPQSPLISLSGQDGNIALMPYGAWWQRHRRAFWQYFHPDAAERYHPLQCKSTEVFLRRLLADPTHLAEHIRYTFTTSIVKVVYGLDIAKKNDPYIAMMEQVLEGGEAFIPGRYFVEFLPILRHIPAWVPGAGFQKDFAFWRHAAQWVRNTMAEKAREGMADGTTSQSVVAQLVANTDAEGSLSSSEDFEIAKNVALTSYEGKVILDLLRRNTDISLQYCGTGGADTTYSTLQVFFLAMAIYPDVQKKAQAELDAIVGPNRLPGHSDRPSLPYISAIVKETLRWGTVLPFSLPHRSIEDMEYDGYFIPAGTMLIPNSWACLHDPETYPDPERFMPERFLRDGKLDPEVCDPARFAFGSGRRKCPGRFFADASIFINVAMILHVFNISPAFDTHGRVTPLELKMTNRIISYPEDCRCTIKPRSEAARQLILGNANLSHIET
ncbi:cytochrome P450 [Cerioporus squamosus]|nr:cytochrome P450 [Cerioporus squamosus]